MRYIIMVRETLSKEIPVYANSITEAVAFAEKRYGDCADEYILSRDDFSDVEFLAKEGNV